MNRLIHIKIILHLNIITCIKYQVCAHLRIGSKEEQYYKIVYYVMYYLTFLSTIHCCFFEIVAPVQGTKPIQNNRSNNVTKDQIFSQYGTQRQTHNKRTHNRQITISTVGNRNYLFLVIVFGSYPKYFYLLHIVFLLNENYTSHKGICNGMEGFQYFFILGRALGVSKASR